jgi:hypothetical protein
MSIITSPLLLGADRGTQVSRSLRFNSADSAYLNQTPASAGNRKTWTWAGWVKKASVGGTYVIFGAVKDATSSTFMEVRIANEQFQITFVIGGVDTARVSTAQVLRDPSAWYHLLAVLDTTQATASNRAKLYINGSAVTQYSGDTNYPVQNTDWNINSTNLHSIGSNTSVSNRYFDGYLADVHFIDGQALTPSSFTTTDLTTGQLIPKAYTGSYGTNGFKLNFSNNATTAALGTDTSSNGNTWTVNNLSVTAGSGNDSLVDTPTSYGTDTGVGGEVRGNYCTWNALAVGSASDLAPSNGNLDATGFSVSGIRDKSIIATIGISSGKWYWEVALTSVTSTPACMIGIASKSSPNELGDFPGANSFGWSYYAANGTKNNSSQLAYGASYTTGDVIGVALDEDNGTLTFYKNGVSQGTAYTGLTSGPYYPAIGHGGSLQAFVTSANFGQRAFAYTAPSGFKALVDTSLPAPTISKPNTVMDTVLYTGTGGSSFSITGLGFSPDWVWIKERSAIADHALFDTVRGTNKRLESNNTTAESTTTGNLLSFDSAGFTLGSKIQVNAAGQTYVAWTFDAGTSTVTNTAGSITSQVRANPSAGFSVVTYTGTGSAGATVGHGLGVAPTFMIFKRRDDSGLNWRVYHKDIGNTKILYLSNTTDATTDPAWNNTTPSSTVFTLGNDSAINVSGGTAVGYIFSPISGYSSFGSYTGNGSTDGPFVYTGFRPRFVLCKLSSAAGADWLIFDTTRSSYNVVQANLRPNTSDAEDASQARIDILSNGFKIRAASGVEPNQSSGIYVYAAFAESPFQYARAR